LHTANRKRKKWGGKAVRRSNTDPNLARKSYNFLAGDEEERKIILGEGK